MKNLGNQIVLLIHEDDDLFCVSDSNSGALNDRNSSEKAASPDAKLSMSEGAIL